MTADCNGWFKFTFPGGMTSTNLIFNDGTNKTLDLSTTTSRYYDGAWLTTNPVISNPKASFTLSATSGSIPLTVTANGTGSTVCNGPLTYKWTFGNGTTATTSSASATYTTAGTFTVKLVVTDAQGKKDSTTQTVTTSSTPTVKLHFKRPAAWANVPKIYYWATSPALTSVAWPGISMTAEATAGWYRYTITGAQTANVIFNNNSSPQTADLMAVTGEVWYDNGWVAKPAGFVRMADNAVLAEESAPSSYSVYPNPVNRSFFLQTNQKTDGDQWVRIFNSAGVEVYRQPVDLSETAVEIQRVPDIKAGLHFVQILDTEGKQVLHSSKIIFQ